MMLRQISRRWRVSLRGQARRYSVSMDYHSKVMAVPFALSKEDAISRTSALASFLAADFPGALSSLAHRFLPQIYNYTRPLKIEPVYLPTWRFDTEVIAKAHVQRRDPRNDTEETVETPATVQSLHNYYPGFTLFPLSLINFRVNPGKTKFVSPTDESFGSLPDSGHQITCLPYTRSPFSLPEAVRSLSFRAAQVGEKLRFEPTSVRFPLIGPAYPVLFPVYLMQYAATDLWDGKIYTLSIVLEAHESHGRVYAEGLGSHFPQDSYFSSSNLSDNSLARRIPLAFSATKSADGEEFGTVIEGTIPTLGVYRGQKYGRSEQLRVKLHKLAFESQPDPPLRQWVEDRMLATELQQASQGKIRKEVINWDDPRVRRFTLPEFAGNGMYWINRMQMANAKHFLGELRCQQGFRGAIVSVTTDKGSVEKREGGEADSFLQAELEKYQSHVEETKPEWLRKWEQRSAEKEQGSG